MKLNKLLEKMENVKVEFYKEDDKFKVNFNNNIYTSKEFLLLNDKRKDAVVGVIHNFLLDKILKKGVGYGKTNLDFNDVIEIFEPNIKPSDIYFKGEFINNKFIIDEPSIKFDLDEINITRIKNLLIDRLSQYLD